MKISDVVKHIQVLGMDTVSFIYFVERYPAYIDRMRAIFRMVDSGTVEVMTSTICLTETLTKPLKVGEKLWKSSIKNCF